MSDLHSIAYSSSHSSSLAWELQNLGVFNADTSQLMMENTPPFFSPLEADYSTGYLQDALFEFSSKRRRLLLFPEDDTKGCNNSIEHSYESYDAFSQISKCDNFNPGMSRSVSIMSEDASLFTDMKTSQEAISAFQIYDSSSLNTQPTSDKQSLYSIQVQPIFSSGAGGEKRSKKRVIEEVVYPFDFVKPGGFEGDLTLNDINERILMPPSRPVRHPVGNFACRPLVSSADGPGLSGKAVVALTRIHTQGRGTITIIRTKG
ncbi:protein XRI1-like isoform X1 [Olea europaea var. sylvestris]|nr:protein XRI1-like isoform X1 [Olea europaea var. sylvestris]